MEAGRSSAFCFSYIPAWAWCRIGTSARYMVNDAGEVLFRQLVLGLDESFSQRSAGRDGGSKALAFEDASKGLRDASKVG